MKKAPISTRKLVVAAMLAALTAVGSALRITVPLDIAGTSSFHLGNILCALSGILLGPWMGGLAIRCGGKNWGYVKALIATVAGAITYALIYLAKSFFYSGLLLHGLTADAAWLTVIGKLPATVFNAVVAIIAAPLLAVAIRTALKKNHLTWE